MAFEQIGGTHDPKKSVCCNYDMNQYGQCLNCGGDGTKFTHAVPPKDEHPEYGKDCDECGGYQYNHRVGCAAVE